MLTRINVLMRPLTRSCSYRAFSVSPRLHLGQRDHLSSTELHLNNDKDTLGTMEKENKSIELGAHPGEIEHIREELQGTSLDRQPHHHMEDATTGPLHQAIDEEGHFDDKDTIIDFSG